MTTYDIPHVARYLLEKHGLAAQGWRFAWDIAKRRAGRCTYSTKTISLSKHYVEMNVVDRPHDVIDTILHEIAHALAPGSGHGPEWKAACDRVGARPERCYDTNVVSMPRGRYVATCGGCGKTYSLHRSADLGNRWRYCLACGPDVGRLTYQDTQSTSTGATTPLQPRRMR